MLQTQLRLSRRGDAKSQCGRRRCASECFVSIRWLLFGPVGGVCVQWVSDQVLSTELNFRVREVLPLGVRGALLVGTRAANTNTSATSKCSSARGVSVCIYLKFECIQCTSRAKNDTCQILAEAAFSRCSRVFFLDLAYILSPGR